MTRERIEKGIPLPPSAPRQPNPRKGAKEAVWWHMDVGDSVFLPERKITTIAPMMSRWVKRTGFKFAVRRVDGGVRVWRTS